MKSILGVLGLVLATGCGAVQDLKDELKSQSQGSAGAATAPVQSPEVGAQTPAKAPETSQVSVSTQVTVSTSVTIDGKSNPQPLQKPNMEPIARMNACAPGPHGKLIGYVVAEQSTSNSFWYILAKFSAKSQAEADAQERLNDGALASKVLVGEQFSDLCVAQLGG